MNALPDSYSDAPFERGDAMLSSHQLARFARMEQDGVDLRLRFRALTSAHQYFHGPGGLKYLSVSDALDDGGIEAVFMGVRIRFQMVLIFNDAYEPRGRAICTHCHRTYGHPVQENLGGFIFDRDGVTDLEPGVDGRPISLETNADHIVLAFLDQAFAANRDNLSQHRSAWPAA
jgi:hypothetical protein